MAKSIIEAEFSFGLVKVVVFANPPRENRENTYRTLGVSRAYKDAASGKWKYTSSFDARDALVLQRLLTQAVDYVVACEQEEAAERRQRREWRQANREYARSFDESPGTAPSVAEPPDTEPSATKPPPANEDIPF